MKHKQEFPGVICRGVIYPKTTELFPDYYHWDPPKKWWEPQWIWLRLSYLSFVDTTLDDEIIHEVWLLEPYLNQVRQIAGTTWKVKQFSIYLGITRRNIPLISLQMFPRFQYDGKLTIKGSQFFGAHNHQLAGAMQLERSTMPSTKIERNLGANFRFRSAHSQPRRVVLSPMTDPWDERYIYLHWSHKDQPFMKVTLPFVPWILWVLGMRSYLTFYY